MSYISGNVEPTYFKYEGREKQYLGVPLKNIDVTEFEKELANVTNPFVVMLFFANYVLDHAKTANQVCEQDKPEFDKAVKDLNASVLDIWSGFKTVMLLSPNYVLSYDDFKRIENLSKDQSDIGVRFCALIADLTCSYFPPGVSKDYRSLICHALKLIDDIMSDLAVATDRLGIHANIERCNIIDALDEIAAPKNRFGIAQTVCCIGDDMLKRVEKLVEKFPNIEIELTNKLNLMVTAIGKIEPVLEYKKMQGNSIGSDIQNFPNVLGDYLFWFTHHYVYTQRNDGAYYLKTVDYLDDVTSAINTLIEFMRNCEGRLTAYQADVVIEDSKKKMLEYLRENITRYQDGSVDFEPEPAGKVIGLINIVLRNLTNTPNVRERKNFIDIGRWKQQLVNTLSSLSVVKKTLKQPDIDLT